MPFSEQLQQGTCCGCFNSVKFALQAGERQADVLSRQISKSTTEGQDLAREREVLLDKLRAAEQVSAVLCCKQIKQSFTRLDKLRAARQICMMLRCLKAEQCLFKARQTHMYKAGNCTVLRYVPMATWSLVNDRQTAHLCEPCVIRPQLLLCKQVIFGNQQLVLCGIVIVHIPLCLRFYASFIHNILQLPAASQTL